jgi:FKBP-type peptidyl-prolyl cis-trans isomerase 2
MVIKDGSTVSVHYKLTVDGEVADTSEGREALKYAHGSGQMIPGFEKALTGMKKGEKKNFELSPEEGYGVRSDEAMRKVPKEAFEEIEGLMAGMVIGLQSPDGQDMQAVVAEVEEKEVTLDLNHPLAGKKLNFEVEVVEVEDSAK